MLIKYDKIKRKLWIKVIVQITHSIVRQQDKKCRNLRILNGLGSMKKSLKDLILIAVFNVAKSITFSPESGQIYFNHSASNSRYYRIGSFWFKSF